MRISDWSSDVCSSDLMARQLVYARFKDETYTRGLNVFTTITKADQDAAYLAVRRGVMSYEERHRYRGPESYINIPDNKDEAEDAIEVELASHPDSDNLVAPVVTTATPKQHGKEPGKENRG